jgi:hypothetical protein
MQSIQNTMITNTVIESGNNVPVVHALSKQYQKKTDKQHILDNPDTYIGSVENVDANMWVFDESLQKIILKQIVAIMLFV